MKLRPIDTLFGRLAFLVIGVLLISHFAWFVLVRFDRNESQSRYATEETVFLLDAVEQHQLYTPHQPLPSRVQLQPLDSPLVPSAQTDERPPLKRYLDGLRSRLPAGTDVRVALEPRHPPELWVHRPTAEHWVVLPLQPLPPPRSVDRMVIWLAIIFSIGVLCALLATWRLQRPLQKLVAAVADFGRGVRVPPLQERGPRELRSLTRGFNQMVSDISQTEHNRQVMLAGVAHDLKTPLARLRLRAELLEDSKLRDGLVRDVDSLTHIVEQFLAFAQDGADQSMPVSVDERCEWIYRNYRSALPEGTRIVRLLRAGPDFVLPTATLDRLLSNLLDNALAYGAPPITIETARLPEAWQLVISDQGPGIAPSELRDASRPFVRLDPARGGNGHSGLGLAIVERLARRVGGICHIANGAEGGLQATLTFPI
jgi:two-component system osmolarity sensor histidine kinase EnvZ